MSCLSDENLAALVDGSADAEQTDAWDRHIDSCDRCAARLLRKRRSGESRPETGTPTSDRDSDPDATITVKPIGKADLHAGADQLPADAIPGYRILKELHRGGQGVVYQAIQLTTKRKVALKVMLEGPFAGPASKRRFEREIALVGSLRHPHIVPIFDSGVAQGRFFYAMEYIRGEPLSRYVQSRKLSVDDTLGLFKKVCDAVDYAHQKGVIHRDLKPSNILVDSRGDPYVLDFGLAKIGGAEAEGDAASMLVSVTGQVLGTPAYMSPEQASGRPDEVDMRSDVYALGVILFELLTGEYPYEVGGQMADTLRTIQEVEPRRPSTIRRQVNDEVETIVLKALSKDKERRYYAAGPLGEDIRRYLAGDPIEAKRDSGWYVLKKNLRRYRAPVAVAAAFVLIVTAALVVSLTFWGKAVDDRDDLRVANKQAEQASEDANTQAALARAESERAKVAEQKAVALSANLAFDRGQMLAEAGHVGHGILWLARTLQLAPSDAANLRRVTRVNLAAWYRELHALRTLLPHQSPVNAVAFSPDRKTLLTRCVDGSVQLWNVSTDMPIPRPLHRAQATVRALAQSPSFRGCLASSPDGSVILTGSEDGTAQLWDAKTREPIGDPLRHDSAVEAVAFSRDGSHILTGCEDGTARLWVVKTREPIGDPFPHKGEVRAVAFSLDGSHILTGSTDNTARLWDVKTRKPIGDPLPHEGAVWAVAFSPDGSLLLTGDEDATARLWDASTLKPMGEPCRHLDTINAVAFSPDGSRFVTGSWDNTARVWNVATSRPIGAPILHRDAVMGVAFSPDGLHIVTGSRDFTAALWDVATGTAIGEPMQHKEMIRGVAFGPKGSRILTGDRGGAVRLWDADTQKPSGKPFFHERMVTEVAFSPDGSRILTGSSDGMARVWNAATGELIGDPMRHEGAVYAVAFSPDGLRILTGGRDKTARLWDAATLNPVGEPLRHEGLIVVVAFSPDGSLILTGCQDKTAQFWDANTGETIGGPLPHEGTVRGVAFSPDGKTFLTSAANTARLWDTSTRTPIGQPFMHESRINGVAFSRDGGTMLTGSSDGTARLWDVATQKPIGAPFRHDGVVKAVAFRPDGKAVLTGSYDNTARLWKGPPAPLQGDVERIVLWTQVITGQELDESGGVQSLSLETWRERREELQKLGGPPILRDEVSQ